MGCSGLRAELCDKFAFKLKFSPQTRGSGPHASLLHDVMALAIFVGSLLLGGEASPLTNWLVSGGNP